MRELSRRYAGWLTPQIAALIQRTQTGREGRAVDETARHEFAVSPLFLAVALTPTRALERVRSVRQMSVLVEYVEVRKDARRAGLGMAAIERLRELTLTRGVRFVVEMVINPVLAAALDRRPLLFRRCASVDPEEGGDNADYVAVDDDVRKDAAPRPRLTTASSLTRK